MKLGLRVILIAVVVGVMATACTSAHAGGPAAESRTGPPPLTVLTQASGQSSGNGDIFIAPAGGSYAGGPEIVSPTGHVIWFHQLPAGVVATDFRTQTYRGQPVLTWFQAGGARRARTVLAAPTTCTATITSRSPRSARATDTAPTSTSSSSRPGTPR